MKRTFTSIALAVTATFLLAACGGGGGGSQADKDEINSLVAEINRSTKEKDAELFCGVIRPADVEATFNTKRKCVKETGAILKQAGEQPVLKVDSVEIDGDTAEVKFADKAGEATFVREDGKWYVPLNNDASASSDDSGGTTGSEAGS